MQLRPYQLSAIDKLRAHLRRGKKRLLLVAPTGAGKTVIASAIISAALAKGTCVVFLAHRRELIHQCYRKLLAAGIPAEQVGVMMANDPLTRADAPIQVCSVDTLRNRELPPAGLLIVDECHRSLAATYVRLITHYADTGAAVIGLTATPYRANGGGLGELYEELVLVASPTELIADGFLVAPRVFSTAGPNLKGVRTRGGDYVEAELAKRMSESGLIGDIVDHYEKHANGRRAIGFAVNREHARLLHARFAERGHRTEYLDGDTPTDERDAMLGRLERGETIVVWSVGTLCEGFDCPPVKVAILARPTKSTGLYLQQAGRILRPFGDESAVILDHAGNALRHGLPQDDREFSLDPAKKSHAGAPTKRCPECDAVNAAGASECEECGHTFELEKSAGMELEERDGELEELIPIPIETQRALWNQICADWQSRNERRIARGERPMKRGWVTFRWREQVGNRKPPTGCRLPFDIATPEEKHAALRELVTTGSTRGYKPGWAIHRFTERFGHAPGVEMETAS